MIYEALQISLRDRLSNEEERILESAKSRVELCVDMRKFSKIPGKFIIYEKMCFLAGHALRFFYKLNKIRNHF